MEFFKKSLLFSVGGCCYMGIELLWRGWSHSSMFLAGGTCFLLLGKLGKVTKNPLTRALVGTGIITGVEFLAGLLVNRNYDVWDYRKMPLNLKGQICLPFCLLWLPVGMGAILLYDILDKRLERIATSLRSSQ